MNDWDDNDPMCDTEPPGCLTFELPPDISDETALQFTNLLIAFHDAICSHFDYQIQRAVRARMRLQDELWREQQETWREHERLAREREFLAAQLDLPFDVPDPF